MGSSHRCRGKYTWICNDGGYVLKADAQNSLSHNLIYQLMHNILRLHGIIMIIKRIHQLHLLKRNKKYGIRIRKIRSNDFLAVLRLIGKSDWQFELGGLK